MQFGDLTLTPLWDGSFRLDGGAMFGVVPKPLWEKRAPADEKNRIRLGLRPLLVQGEKTLLVDAGIGGKMDAKSVEISWFLIICFDANGSMYWKARPDGAPSMIFDQSIPSAE